MVLEPGKSEVSMLGQSVSGEDPLSSSLMAVFSLGPRLAEGARELPGVFFFFFLNKGTNPIHKGSVFTT